MARPGAAAAGDTAACAGLIEGLLISGFAMQAHGDSRPASGCEHLISHVWEMERLTCNGEPVAHGACVGVGTIAILALYEWFLAQPADPAAIRRARAAGSAATRVEAEIVLAFAEPRLADNARAEMSAKLADGAPRARRLSALEASWQELGEELKPHAPPAREMAARLRAAGCATRPTDVGATLAKLAVDIRRARLIRRRFTLLDLLDDIGWLDRGVSAVVGDEALWGEPDAAGEKPRHTAAI
jgi:glycerol-1-phosphate dehydrogenase [NAD(P)+]